MRVLLALTYYRPHVSGLTIYVERLANVLAARGHDVTVLASRHDRVLPKRTADDGVRLVRVPVAFRVSKGVVMPTYGIEAVRQVREHDVVSIHLPQFEGWALGLCGKALRRPTVLTYHCDLQLPDGALNAVAERVVSVANGAAAALADRIVAYTQDYADHTPLLRRHADRVVIVPPPVVMPPPAAADVESFRRRHELDGPGPFVGLATRFAAEKGIDVLLEAVTRLAASHPELTVVFAGAEEVVGEEAYRRRLAPAIDALGARWRPLGVLDPVREMPAFFGAVDCLVVPSVNSTESFGLVQAEAMLCGTPVVASNLPGVRQPVRMTGMGEVVPVGDANALAAAVRRVLDEPERYERDPEEVASHFDLARTADGYEALFRELVAAG